MMCVIDWPFLQPGKRAIHLVHWIPISGVRNVESVLMSRYHHVLSVCHRQNVWPFAASSTPWCWACSWWRHQMKTFSALLANCVGNSPVPGEFPTQRPVTRSFDVFFDMRLNKRLRKQSWGWWFETLSRPLWRHCNVMLMAEQGLGQLEKTLHM